MRNAAAAARPRPHRLALFWRINEDAAGRRRAVVMTAVGLLQLNDAATAVWELVDGRRGVAGIAAALRRRYPATARAELRQAAAGVLAELQKRGAIVTGWTPLDPCPARRLPRRPPAPGA